LDLPYLENISSQISNESSIGGNLTNAINNQQCITLFESNETDTKGSLSTISECQVNGDFTKQKMYTIGTTHKLIFVTLEANSRELFDDNVDEFDALIASTKINNPVDVEVLLKDLYDRRILTSDNSNMSDISTTNGTS
jgi:hypothetical protein